MESTLLLPTNGTINERSTDLWLLLELLPDQITRYWDLLKTILPKDVLGSYPGKVYAALIEGKFQLWSCLKHEDLKKPLGFCLTSVTNDDVLETTALVIHSVYGLDEIPKEAYDCSFDVLRNFAERRKCNKIVIYTDNSLFLKLAQSWGFKSNFIYLTREV